MYQLEIKSIIVSERFPSSSGWRVNVDVDAMERCVGGLHPEGKKRRVEQAEKQLQNNQAVFRRDDEFGRADIVARHEVHGTFVVEVEGTSSRQKDQAVFGALGQLIVSMHRPESRVQYVLAVPDEMSWERQLRKIPNHVANMLNIEMWLVSASNVRLLFRNET